MERLTAWNNGDAYYPKCFEEPCIGMECSNERCEFEYEKCKRLAEYEDTGLSPEEIMDKKTEYCVDMQELLKEIDELYKICFFSFSKPLIAIEDVIRIIKKHISRKFDWIPVSERLPEDVVNPITRDAYVYPVTVDLDGVTDTRYYSFCRGHWYNQGPKEMDDLVIAWKERPEPYRP